MFLNIPRPTSLLQSKSDWVQMPQRFVSVVLQSVELDTISKAEKVWAPFMLMLKKR